MPSSTTTAASSSNRKPRTATSSPPPNTDRTGESHDETYLDLPPCRIRRGALRLLTLSRPGSGLPHAPRKEERGEHEFGGRQMQRIGNRRRARHQPMVWSGAKGKSVHGSLLLW